jgi:hypothetical protein
MRQANPLFLSFLKDREMKEWAAACILAAIDRLPRRIEFTPRIYYHFTMTAQKNARTGSPCPTFTFENPFYAPKQACGLESGALRGKSIGGEKILPGDLV